MKKTLPVLAALGAVAAFAIYKIKKEEQKKIIDLDEGMLYDDEDTSPADLSDQVKEGYEDIKESATDTLEDVKDIVKEFSEDFPALLKEEVEGLKKAVQEGIADLKEIGNAVGKERPIQHLVVFEQEKDRDAFKNAIINRGYVVSVGDEDGELNVLHICPLDEEKLTAHVLFIANEAHKHNGSYAGWFNK